MHEHSEVGTFLNTFLFDPLAKALGLHVAAGHHAVPDHIVMVLLVSLGLITLALVARRGLSVDRPTRLQHLLEVLMGAIQGLMTEVIGKNTRQFLPLIFTLALYIFCGNVLGMVPGFMSPTSNINVTAACAICVFIYYNYHGVRKHGVLKYLKHFAGPVWWLAWLLFPVEIVSHMARPFSLSMRLFGNILSEELIISSLNQYIFPFLVALPVMFLGLFASTIQAFIFILLTMVYLGGAVEDSHEEGHASGHGEAGAHAEPHAAAA
jgi:F-type H+-transporting ATPase subunit a